MSRLVTLLDTGILTTEHNRSKQIEELTFKTIFYAYVSELVTYNLRVYAFPYPTTGWKVLAVIQLIVNLICTILVHIDCQRFPNPSTAFAFAGVLAVNIAESIGVLAVNIAESIISSCWNLVQFFLNLFGYSALLTFWLTVADQGDDCNYTNKQRIVFQVLHSVFTFSIIVGSIFEITSPGDLRDLDLIEELFELFLLGYLLALIK